MSPPFFRKSRKATPLSREESVRQGKAVRAAQAALGSVEAVRGTFDPMYISYTLGKLAIRKLAADWLAAHPDKALGDFHDAFLANACAPLPLIRHALIGDDSPPL